MTLAPLLGGALVDVFSHKFMFAIVIVVGVISTFLAIFLLPQMRRS
jgi:predicted MFS family arabinose efflux permease